MEMSATGITYYEDELDKSGNYIESVKKCLENRYGDEQQKQQEKLPYKDPDGWLNCSYYWELTQFLNKRESWLEDKMKKMGKAYQPYRYIAPNKCKKPKEVEEKDQEKGSDKNEIIVKIVNSDGKDEEKFRLKSDQFGFSVGDTTNKDFWTKFEEHPYGYLCKLVEKESEIWDKLSEKEVKEVKGGVYEEIAQCIYDTRTLGGGFLWGTAISGAYNKARGGSKNKWENRQYYIEDRVDLTLLEMKHLFEWIELGMPEEDTPLFNKNKIGDRTEDNRVDTLYNTIKNKIDKIENKEQKKATLDYIKWLQHFDTFGNYIEFFCFDDFVDEDKTWMPLDIMESKLKLKWDDENETWICERENAVFLKDPTKYKQRKAHSIYREDRTAADLKQMIENVRILTLARSYRMQEVLDGVSN